MLISRWRVRPHLYFGAVHVPIIELEIRSPAGICSAFSLCVDSGAVVSLLPRSAADALGLDLTTGRPIQLGAVGKQPMDAWIHELDLSIADLPLLRAHLAIAVHEHAPALLGRLGVFDRLEITFDAARRETRIRVA